MASAPDSYRCVVEHDDGSSTTDCQLHALLAEVARLREALTEIADGSCACGGDADPTCYPCIAQEALDARP